MDLRFAAITERLADIQNALNNLVGAVTELRESGERQGEKVLRTELTAVVRLPDEVTEYCKDERISRPTVDRRERTRIRLEVMGLIIAGALAIITLFTLVIFKNQLTEMQKATKAAVDAATAAQQANRDAESRFKEDSRPYIWFTATGNGSPEFIPQTNQIVWSFHYTDYGRTPAYGIQFVQEQIKVGDKPLKTMYRKEYNAGIGTVVPPGKDDFATMASDPGINPQEFSRLLTLDHSILIKVRIDYTDAGGAIYESGFCQDRLATGATEYCKEGNYIIRVH